MIVKHWLENPLQQTSSNPDISFELRSFRFNDPNGSPEDEQNQLFTCSLYIEDTEPAAEHQTIEDCSCYSEDECTGNIIYEWVISYESDLVNIDLTLARVSGPLDKKI